VVYSLYDDGFTEAFDHDFKTKVLTDGVIKKDVAVLENPDYVALSKLAINFSDGFVIVGNNIHPEIEEYLKMSNKPVIRHHPETYIQDYGVFYDELLQP